MIQPLTVKARQAIHQYVEVMLREDQAYTVRNAVAWTLAVERIRRDDLYWKLEQRGYRWHPDKRVWILKAAKQK